jgi:non-specific serine/threonine protein kinase
MTFKGTNKKIKEIANEVNVRYILEGSVRKSGNNLRITAQLIDALNDGHVWTEKYSGTMEDVFDIQEKVSRSIVEALDLKLTIKEDTILSQHPIQNAKAYECYIRARQEMWKLTEQGLNNAIVLAEQGLDLEPDSALLYATLSTAYLFFYHYGIKPDTSSVEKAHHYASKSLELDSNCPQAHVVYGVIEFKKGNVQEASEIFKKALSLDKNSTDALSFLIPTYFLSGKPEEAKPYSEKLLQLDPLLPLSHALYGVIEWYSGKGKETLPYFRKWLKMDPESPFARLLCSYNFAFNNEREESIQVLETMIRDMPTLIFGKFALFFRSALQGDRESALKYATEELKDGAASIDYFPIIMAFGYALIDEKDEAVKLLNRTLHFGHCTYPLLLNFEIFQNVLKDHPGFHAYMEEIKKRSEKFVV